MAESDRKARAARFDDLGREIPDRTPVEMPLKWKRPPSIHEMIARAVRESHWEEKMRSQGMETFREADDFEIDGEEEAPFSQYQVNDMQDEVPSMMIGELGKRPGDGAEPHSGEEKKVQPVAESIKTPLSTEQPLADSEEKK